MSTRLLDFSFSQSILDMFRTENKDTEATKSQVQETKSKDKEKRLQHIKEKVAAERAFKEITLLYGWGRFTCASSYRLNEMVKCLKIGFNICNNKMLYERWAFEVMPGCLKSLQKKERRKKWEDRNKSITINWKVKLFKNYSKSLAIIINSLEKNEITRQSAKAILRELISDPTKDVEVLIERYTAINEKKPVSQEEVQDRVKLFLKNIEFYFLRERIEDLMFQYFIQSRSMKCYKTIPQIFKDIRKIVKENNVVSLIQKNDKERFVDVSKNIHVSSKYYQTTTEGIQNVLNECLKLNDMPIPKDIFTYSFNGCARGKIHFFCQPIMEALNFKTDRETIMETFKKLTI